MVETTETAWRILQIVALALPAYAILLQVYVRLTPTEISDIARQYEVSFIALIIMGPMALAGLISTFVIYRSIANGPIAYAVALISISFLVTPIVLVHVWRSNMELFKSEFPENKKSLTETSEEISQKYPKLTFASYLFGLGLGIFFLVSSLGIWFSVLGTIQVILSLLMIVLTLAPEIDLEEK